ncbi:MAG TPA: PhzF family phenazine biosynthesis protein [Jatrophihabitans sp.]|nr:PhzF family phenazine biosynthesis protein [Jatrophihabitans sp.]
MQVPFVQIDAFAAAPFEGNPAAVLLLPGWPADSLLADIAGENNLSETAYVVPGLPPEARPPDDEPAYHLRWFTPAIEVELCGHATLAAAAYLLDDVHPEADRVRFWTRSGWLAVDREPTGGYTMDFPSQPSIPTEVDPSIAAALGVPVVEALRGADLVYLVRDAHTVAGLTPDLDVVGRLPVRGVAVTAAGDGTGYDFVSRWFGAYAGVAEDPVTGSAHAQLAPLWAQRLGRPRLRARQLSPRGGSVECRVAGDRTFLTGQCRRFLTGTAMLPD